MGLDMYLMKAPRLDSVTIQQVCATEEWFGYCKRPNEYRTSSFEEWCGVSRDDLPSEKVMELLRPYYVERFASWDTNHVYPHSDIIQNVGYWRKANQIHRWFVDNVQDGDDDCDYHEECTKGIIEELLNTCKRVIDEWFKEEGLTRSLFVSTFRDQITGKSMYDVAFQYTPAFDQRI